MRRKEDKDEEGEDNLLKPRMLELKNSNMLLFFEDDFLSIYEWGLSADYYQSVYCINNHYYSHSN